MAHFTWMKEWTTTWWRYHVTCTCGYLKRYQPPLHVSFESELCWVSDPKVTQLDWSR